MKVEHDFLRGPAPCSLRAAHFSTDLTLLVLAPHPDDFDAVGVTMRLFRDRGAALYVAVDRSGSGVEDTYGPSPTLAIKAAIREAEQRRSCRLFGLPDERLIFFRMVEDVAAQPLDSAHNHALLAALLASVRPDLVCLPHGNDTNTGHQRMYGMFRQVAQVAEQPITALYARDPKTISLRMDLYTAFAEPDARWKAELLRCHDSQQQRNRHTRGRGFDERILDTNRQIAGELRLVEPYAEAFEVEQFPI